MLNRELLDVHHVDSRSESGYGSRRGTTGD